MKKLLISILLTLFFSVSIFAQNDSSQKKHEFKGVIKTQNGEVIAGANLYFKNGERKFFVVTDIHGNNEQKFTVVTDINGEFTVELDTGSYEITVNDVLSKSFRAFIKIQSEGANPNNVAFTVKPNKNLCGLRGNEICPKPTSLPRPPYPAAARAANIIGEVIVKIKINSNGEVISANAINGHPLLRKAAVTGAKKAKFEKATDDRQTEIYMTYVFLNAKQEKAGTSKYKNFYRVNMLNHLVLIDTPSYKAI